MPKTKLRKVKRETKENKEVDKQMCEGLKIIKRELDKKIDDEIAQFENAIDMFEFKFKSMANKTLAELGEETDTFSENLAMVFSASAAYKSTTDEGYLTSSSSTSTEFKNHSNLSNASRGVSFASSTSFKTPMPSATFTKQMAMSMGLVTPKVRSDKAVAIARPAKANETVISMTGSPVLLNCGAPQADPQTTIPLGDGRVLTVKSEKGLRMSGIPEIDIDTKRRLDILKKNIEKLLEN